ncbi:MAG: Regulator of nonsense transcripts upf2 [Marteilia pararefringens]
MVTELGESKNLGISISSSSGGQSTQGSSLNELRQKYPAAIKYCEDFNSQLELLNSRREKLHNVDISKFNATYMKSLDSSLKKNTSIVNKLKIANIIIDSNFIEEIRSTNVSHYIAEIINSVFDNETLARQLFSCVDLFLELSYTYTKFNDEFLKICDSRIQNISDNNTGNIFFLQILINLCLIQIFDSKTNCQKIIDILRGFCKNSNIQLVEMLNIFNETFSTHVYLIFGHHPRRLNHIIVKKIAPIVPEIVPELNRYKSFPEKFHNTVEKIIEDFHKTKVEVLVEEEVKALAKLENACKMSMESKGEVSKKLNADYDTKLEFLTQLRAEALKYSQITLKSIKQFSEDEELTDINARTPDSDQLLKMFGTEQDIDFYQNLLDMSEQIRSSKIDQSMTLGKTEIAEVTDTSSHNINSDIDKFHLINDCHPSSLSNVSPLPKETSAISNFIMRLMNCYNKDIIDKLIIEFATNFHTKTNLKKLLSTFTLVPPSRLELLPFFCRFIATYRQVNADFTNTIVNKSINNLYRSIGASDRKHMESRIKYVHYISEFIKFSLISPIRILNIFRNTKSKLTESDVELCCILFNSAGQYIYNHPAYHNKAKIFLQSLFKVKSRLATNRDLCTLIDEAYYRTFDQNKEQRKSRDYTVVQRFIQHLVYDSLTSATLERTACILNSVPDEDIPFVVETLCSPWNLVKKNITLLTQLIIHISDLNPSIEMLAVHRLIELIYSGLLTNTTSHLLHRISCIELLIEFYKYECFDDNILYTLLGWHFRLGIDPFLYNSFSVCDPASDLFRFQCASIIIRETVEYLDSDNNASFKLMIANYQLYYRYKHESSVWNDNLPQSQNNTDFSYATESNFPIECEQLFADTIKKCKKYFIFDLLDTYSQAKDYTLQLEKSTEKKMNQSLEGRSIKQKITNSNDKDSIENSQCQIDSGCNNISYNLKKNGEKTSRRMGHKVRNRDDVVIINIWIIYMNF